MTRSFLNAEDALAAAKPSFGEIGEYGEQKSWSQKADKVKSKNAKLQIKKSKSEYRDAGGYANTDTNDEVCKTSAARGQAGYGYEPPLTGYNAGRC